MTERRGFFGCLRNLRMTENKLRRCPERGEGMTKKESQDDKKAEEILHSANAPFRMTKKGRMTPFLSP